MRECPYCKEELETGYIPTGTTPPQWLPKEKKASMLRGGISKDAISLNGKNTLRGYQIEACRCRRCGMIFLNMKQ